MINPIPLPRGVRRRGNSFVADVSYRGQRRTGTAATAEEAAALRAALLADMRGAQVAPLVSPAAPTWSLRKAIGVTAQVAWRGTSWGPVAEHHANAFAKFIGQDRPLDTIDMNTLDQWVLRLEADGKSDGTINRYLAAVSKVFTTAQERGGVAAKPKFPRRKEVRGRVRWLTPEEEAAALAYFEHTGQTAARDLFVLLIDTGLRMGEALRLEMRDVDFKTGLLTVWQSKNGEPRSVPMTARVKQILSSRSDGQSLQDVVGASKLTGAQKVAALSKHQFRQAWDRLKAHLELTHDTQFVPHALRHTCASRLVQRGVPLKVVQEWLGHKTISVTMRYAHLAPANLLDAVKKLEGGN